MKTALANPLVTEWLPARIGGSDVDSLTAAPAACLKGQAARGLIHETAIAAQEPDKNDRLNGVSGNYTPSISTPVMYQSILSGFWPLAFIASICACVRFSFVNVKPMVAEPASVVIGSG